jgi:hypothetical protein
MSVRSYHSTLCNVPEDRRSDLHGGGSLNSYINFKFLLILPVNNKREHLQLHELESDKKKNNFV